MNQDKLSQEQKKALSESRKKENLSESQVTSLFTSIGHVSLKEVGDNEFTLVTSKQHKAEHVLSLFYEMKSTFPRLDDIELVDVSPYVIKVLTK